MLIDWTAATHINWTAVSALIGASGVFMALTNIRTQLRIAVFSEYTKRYADIVDRLPFDARRIGAQFEPEKLPDAERKEYLNAMRRYFNLCSEELYLRNSGRIARTTWKIWEEGIEDTVSWPGFEYAWKELRREYSRYAQFTHFIDDAIRKSAATGRAVGAGH
jgi:hypothetical protein